MGVQHETATAIHIGEETSRRIDVIVADDPSVGWYRPAEAVSDVLLRLVPGALIFPWQDFQAEMVEEQLSVRRGSPGNDLCR